MRNLQVDKLALINVSLKMVKELLLEYDEYYPIATAIEVDGATKPILYFDGNENPFSEDLIASYHEILDDKIKNLEIRAYSIAYDVRVSRNNKDKKTDAIAIKIKHIETEEVIIYFYPYTLKSKGKIILGDGWGVIQ